MLTEKHIKGLMALQHLLANVGSPGQAGKLTTPDLMKAMSPTNPAPVMQTPSQNPIDAINARTDLTKEQKIQMIKQLQIQQQQAQPQNPQNPEQPDSQMQ